MSTKKYLQNGKWPGIQQDQTVKLSQVEGDLEIDVDIEKQIAQLQEARLAGEIEKPKELSIDPEKQLNEWHLEKGLKTFLANVEFEKEDLDKNGIGKNHAKMAQFNFSNKDLKAFDILGLDVTINWENIRSKFKKLVKKFHPDMNSGNRKFEEKLKVITLAYTQLKRTLKK